MLVWKAMPSITPTMSLTRREPAWICSIERTATCTAAPPASATSRTRPASASACAAPCALRSTAAVSSCTLAEVCSRLAACVSVRSERARLSLASWLPACATTDELLRMSATVSDMRPASDSSAWPMAASSSRPCTSTRAAKSPSAMRVTACWIAPSAPDTVWKKVSAR